jgi:2-polyprenyl-3-methyl-5-hydroxy-6-metoxy-1,4-benzoquinol methylase
VTRAEASAIESPYGRAVAAGGLAPCHRLMLAEVPAGARVLDIGCATGYLGAQLSRRGCSVTGLERNPASAAAARRHCDEVVEGDIERPADRERLATEFDAILIGDVLEHLVDPWDTLRFVRSLLGPGGVVIASIPNVGAWTVRLGLLAGRFEYTETGLLDRTHLRFFTRRTAHELVRGAGFVVERESFTPIDDPPPVLRWAFPAIGHVTKPLRHLWPELLAQQFVLRLRPA